MYKLLLVITLTLCVGACTQNSVDKPAMHDTLTTMKDTSPSLATVLAAQPEATQERYKFRHPQETLEFFGIKPGMTVVEALPGGGWYTKILLSYLGPNGHLVGADYPMEMWPLFGFFSDEFIEEKKTWTYDWPIEAREWRDNNSARVSAFVFGSAPDRLKGRVDAVLFIRALHNMNRFESKGGYLSTALTDAYRLLKPGGVVGVVQHQARDSMPDDWADGSKGYLKKDALIASFRAAGFEYVAETDVNANPKDQPTTDDIVWRLQPTLITSRDNPELQEKMKAIGESNRMTLKFTKPK